MRVSKRTMIAAVLAALGFTVKVQADTLLFEDFEGFTLKSYVSPTETTGGVSKGDGTDWTDELPAGWTADFDSTPIGDPIEFQGWRIHDVDSWAATESGQDREKWTVNPIGSHGSALLVDPDAYDDGTNVDDKLFNASITTPPIDLSNIAPGSVELQLDSFFRNEVTSDLYIDVSFDGGASYSNIFTRESDNLPDGQDFEDHLDLAIDGSPGSGSLVFKFSLREGSNDWWWAIDNVDISGRAVPEPSSIALGGVTLVGLLAAARRRR